MQRWCSCSWILAGHARNSAGLQRCAALCEVVWFLLKKGSNSWHDHRFIVLCPSGLLQSVPEDSLWNAALGSTGDISAPALTVPKAGKPLTETVHILIGLLGCTLAQDFGPGYRNVIGIPGGVGSPLFSILQVDPLPTALLSHQMALLEACNARWRLLKGFRDRHG